MDTSGQSDGKDLSAENGSGPSAKRKEMEDDQDDTLKDEKDTSAVTMLDVLKDEEELEEDANAVLGAADDQNCTYDEGYKGRQALYACTTCSQPDNPDFVPAGMCLACSYHCHEGHELVELYTKRQFRCDCPTGRFSSDHKCRLKPERKETNSSNSYNQNFSGLYCECARPYPDPDDSTVDEMIQCALCEDWYHGRHLGLAAGPPKDSEYGEMICRNCVKKFPILLNYKNCQISEVKEGKTSEENEKSEIKCKLKNKPENDKNGAKKEDAAETSTGEKKDCDQTKESAEVAEDDKTDKAGEDKEAKKDEKTGFETLFLPEGWRALQCRCSECKDYYHQNKIEFLLNEEDTVHHYESQGKKRAGQFEQGMEALSQMDRIQQVEAISMYNNMKTGLMDYLANFAREGKVVKEEDIRKFFSQMKSAKRPRLDLPPPDTCK